MAKGSALKPGTKRSSWAVRDPKRYSVAEHSVVHVHSLAFVVDQHNHVESVIMVHPTDGLNESGTHAELRAERNATRKRNRANRAKRSAS